MLKGKTVLLGVTGSIAAYKAANIITGLTKLECNVNVIMTKAATEFITPLTLKTLSKNIVSIDVFQEYTPRAEHISLASSADLMLIAPATANIIGKMANGIADDMLTTTFLAIRNKPILIAPAMNTNMYENPIVQSNLSKLVDYGVKEIPPRESMLACGYKGLGALANVSTILEAVKENLPDDKGVTNDGGGKGCQSNACHPGG